MQTSTKSNTDLNPYAYVLFFLFFGGVIGLTPLVPYFRHFFYGGGEKISSTIVFGYHPIMLAALLLVVPFALNVVSRAVFKSVWTNLSNPVTTKINLAGLTGGAIFTILGWQDLHLVSFGIACVFLFNLLWTAACIRAGRN